MLASLLVLIAPCLASDGAWTDVPGSRHSPKNMPSAVYDAGRKSILLFGGQYEDFTREDIPEGYFSNQLLEFKGEGWSVPAGASAAPITSRASALIAYDPVRQATVIAQGESQMTANDTWTYKDGAFTLLGNDAALQGNTGRCMFFNDVISQCCMIDNQGRVLRLNGQQWTWLNATPIPGWGSGPLERGFWGASYNSSSHRLALFGGSLLDNRSSTDTTWIYDASANTWASAVSATHPCARMHVGMCYSKARQRHIMFGGCSLDGGLQVFSDAWELNDNTGQWKKLLIENSFALTNHQMAEDASSGLIYAFGGWMSNAADRNTIVRRLALTPRTGVKKGWDAYR